MRRHEEEEGKGKTKAGAKAGAKASSLNGGLRRAGMPSDVHAPARSDDEQQQRHKDGPRDRSRSPKRTTEASSVQRRPTKDITDVGHAETVSGGSTEQFLSSQLAEEAIEILEQRQLESALKKKLELAWRLTVVVLVTAAGFHIVMSG